MWSSDIRPSYVPQGFRLLAAAAGPAGAEPASPEGDDHSGQGHAAHEGVEAAISYTRGDDMRRALRIQVAPRWVGIAVRETGGHQGIPVDLGLDLRTDQAVEAIYQDGVWVMGPGPDQHEVGEGLTIHWDTSDLHSLTLVGPVSEVTVRGARSLGVTFDELVKVARSLPPAAVTGGVAGGGTGPPARGSR